jgi:hypothetical protein
MSREHESEGEVADVDCLELHPDVHETSETGTATVGASEAVPQPQYHQQIDCEKASTSHVNYSTLNTFASQSYSAVRKEEQNEQTVEVRSWVDEQLVMPARLEQTNTGVHHEVSTPMTGEISAVFGGEKPYDLYFEPTLFHWNGSGNSVCVVGSFNFWNKVSFYMQSVCLVYVS